MGSSDTNRTAAPGIATADVSVQPRGEIGPALTAMLQDTAPGGWIRALGLELIHATPDEVVAEWTVDERHLQPHGIVHGGVHASVIETCCSVGAGLAAPAGKVVVGVENHTSFVRAVRAGRLRARAVPLHAGRRAQLWECRITDAAERLIATGRLRVLCVDAEAGQER